MSDKNTPGRIVVVAILGLLWSPGCATQTPGYRFPAVEPVPSQPAALGGPDDIPVFDDWSRLEGLWTTYAKLSSGEATRVNLFIQRNGECWIQLPEKGCQAKLEFLFYGKESVEFSKRTVKLKNALSFSIGDGGKGKNVFGDLIKIQVNTQYQHGPVTQRQVGSSDTPCKKHNGVVLGVTEEEDAFIYVETTPRSVPIAVGALVRAQKVAR